MLNHPSQAIGVFDSGVGGISVLKHISQTLHHENLVYFADSHYAPYGNQTPDFIRERAQILSDFLIKQGAKALVVACNTATAAAVAMLREQYQLPIIGMEPAVKPAATATKSGVIGVLATSGTLKSAQFAALLEHYGQGVEVVTQACIGLVECIERGELHAASTKTLIQQYVKPLLLVGADTIVLGCTHYPFVRGLIEEIIKETTDKKVTLIDTGAAVARHLKHCLQESSLLAESTHMGEVKFWTNNQANDAEQVISLLWGDKVEVVKTNP